MCGIAGVIEEGGRSASISPFDSILARMAHRGPDDRGLWTDESVILGHTRLSIVDLANGHQPMCNEDGAVWITFNGEIYNFGELRNDLERRGHRFRTSSDTEAIIHAFEQYGFDCLAHFRGMFAFAIWDRSTKTLFLARDRVGKKPLFYTHQPGWFGFASELQALIAHPKLSKEIDATAIDDYLTYGYIPAPRTIYRGIHKLLPGHFLAVQLSERLDLSLRIERWWQLHYDVSRVAPEQEAAEGLLAVLTASIRARLSADVPIGALLSGGVDSSVIVAIMSRLIPKVKTFSIGFGEQEYNEAPFARAVAERYSTEHHELIICPQLLDILPTLVLHYGEPYADSSSVPTYYVAQMTRQHVTVALNGDGGDECLGGYERYLAATLGEQYLMLPSSLRTGVIERASHLIPQGLSRFSRVGQIRRFLEVAAWPWNRRYTRWMSYFDYVQRRELYDTDLLAQVNEYTGESWIDTLLSAHTAALGRTVNALLATDVDSYLPNDLLVKMDIATMANSLEVRSPFLDHEVMEYCARLPISCKLRGRTLKYLLKRVAREMLPARNVRRRKMGFGAPVSEWMRTEHRSFFEHTLLGERSIRRGLFRREYIRRLLDEHNARVRDHGQRLWALLWLELWFQTFID